MSSITAILCKSGKIALKLGAFIYWAVQMFDQISRSEDRRGR